MRPHNEQIYCGCEVTRTAAPRPRRHDGGGGARALSALLALVAIGLLTAWPAAAAKTVKQRQFATPEAALSALGQAAAAGDQAEMTAIFGPEREKLLTGDPVEDAAALKRFAANLEKSATLEKVDDSKFIFRVGEDHWPSPIPIVKVGKKWQFDTAAGVEEILNRRIGQNELSAIMTCRAYVVAQWEYFTQAKDTSENGLAVYAQRFISRPGTHDGLYWETAPDETPSPLGELISQAREEGYPAGQSTPGERHTRTPYHGYFFHILKAQGQHAPGGAFSYVINGNMIAGYALIAFPDKWGSSGIMTFIVNGQGKVYEKNLGPDTVTLARAITEYDPDPSWTLVTEP
jgi:hypothetical protein